MTDNSKLRVSAQSPRKEKVSVVDEIKDNINNSQATLLTEYRGLTVEAISTLRRDLAASDTKYKNYKKTLLRKAAQDEGLEELLPLLEGPLAIAFVKGDAAGAAQVIQKTAKGNEALIVKGGLIGKSFITHEDIIKLSKLPSREVLLAQVAGTLQSPLSKTAGLIAAIPSKAAYAFKALVDKKSAEES